MGAECAIVRLAERAEDQWGLVTAAQAAIDGIGTATLTKLCSSGKLRRLAQGVYQVAGATDMQHLDEKVAWLRLAPERPAYERQPLDADGGVISHRSAALLYGIGDLLTPAVEIIVPKRRQTRDRAVKFRREHLTPTDVTTVHGLLPTTTIERTIADLAAEHIDGGHLGDMIADAAERGALNTHDLAQRIAPHGPAYGVTANGKRLIGHLLDQAGRKPQEASIPDVIALALMGAGAAAADMLRDERVDLQKPTKDAVQYAQADLPRQLADSNLRDRLAAALAELSSTHYPQGSYARTTKIRTVDQNADEGTRPDTHPKESA